MQDAVFRTGIYQGAGKLHVRRRGTNRSTKTGCVSLSCGCRGRTDTWGADILRVHTRRTARTGVVLLCGRPRTDIWDADNENAPVLRKLGSSVAQVCVPGRTDTWGADIRIQCAQIHDSAHNDAVQLHDGRHRTDTQATDTHVQDAQLRRSMRSCAAQLHVRHRTDTWGADNVCVRTCRTKYSVAELHRHFFAVSLTLARLRLVFFLRHDS